MTNYIGREIAAARALTGLGQKQLAALAGINHDTIRRWEKAGTEPIKARDGHIDKFLACLAQHGIAMTPGHIIHVRAEKPKQPVIGVTGARANDAAVLTSGTGERQLLR